MDVVYHAGISVIYKPTNYTGYVKNWGTIHNDINYKWHCKWYCVTVPTSWYCILHQFHCIERVTVHFFHTFGSLLTIRNIVYCILDIQRYCLMFLHMASSATMHNGYWSTFFLIIRFQNDVSHRHFRWKEDGIIFFPKPLRQPSILCKILLITVLLASSH